MVRESLKKKGELSSPFFGNLAEWTGLEPATPGVTGRYSNQLNYHSSCNAECTVPSKPESAHRPFTPFLFITPHSALH